MSQKGTVSINAENIMPVIKKWLYSDKDIFVRELVSNGCDAVNKFRRIAQAGDAEGSDSYRVDVTVDKKAGTLTFSDNGVGMTKDEVIKYIAQVAFSGAADFLERYKKDEDNVEGGIIGHFGLGFYSAFMVSDRVEIQTKSYIENEPAVKWVSEDGMEYDIDEGTRETRGTDIILTLSEDGKEFLDKWTVKATLEKHCAFMPVEIYLSEVTEPEKDENGNEKPLPEPEMVNDTHPLWMKKPQDVTDEEYKEFYRKVFKDYDEPLFWIHLNAEYPFNLKGILYFPKLKNEFTANEGMVKLYNNQVFVADNIKEVIPEFLLLLKGVIDCPDLPLNVSRSFLQNDGYVKKMAAYITRKVADRLTSEFKEDRTCFEGYWEDIHPFVKYGTIKDDKFYDRVKDVLLFKTTDGKYKTLEELKGECTNDDGTMTILYTSDEKRQAQMIRLYTDQGKCVTVLNTLIDNNFMSFLEYTRRDDKLSFKRVDADTNGLTSEEEAAVDKDRMTEIFRKASGDSELTVETPVFKNDGIISMITVDEQMRRFEDMSRAWGRDKDLGLPVKRTLTLNAAHPVIKWIEKCEDEEMRDRVCLQVLDLAEMARQPLEAERMVEFLERSNQLLTMLVNK